ncbi:MAG: hypothetical protein HY893_06520 [Deltaproteobacteria bacterium]|nr:hypothetical protein [Deltaproteobacteria bacterium]
MSLNEVFPKSRYIAIVPILMALAASVSAFIWGTFRTTEIFYRFDSSIAADGFSIALTALFSVLYTYFIPTALFIVALSMLYEFSLEEADLTDLPLIRDLPLVILVIAIGFLKHFVDWQSGQDPLALAISIAIVVAAVAAFIFQEKEGGEG